MKTLYIIWLNEVEVGPLSLEDLLARKDLTPETHVRAVDAEEWSTWGQLNKEPEAQDLSQTKTESAVSKRQVREAKRNEASPRDALRRETAYPVARLLLTGLMGLASLVAIGAWLGFFTEESSTDASSGMWLFYAVIATILVPVTVAMVFFFQAVLDIADCALKKDRL